MQTYSIPVEVGRHIALRDVERWSLMGAAVAALAYGARQRSTPGLWIAVAAAAPMAYRAWTGSWPAPLSALFERRDDTRAALGGDGGIHVHEAIRLETPLAEVYRFWRRLENLPRFMRHLERVTESADGRSHWVARGPGGLELEWDAEIINDVPNTVIGWRSLSGGDVISSGSVNFDSVRAGRSTQVAVKLQYDPPAGKLGRAVAWLFGHAPEQTIREDLRHLKQMLEAGEIARAYDEGRSR